MRCPGGRISWGIALTGLLLLLAPGAWATEEETEACLSCHNRAAKQMHQTIHWTWLCPADPEGKMGKAGSASITSE